MQQHLAQLVEVAGGQRLVAPQALQGQMAVMLSEELARLVLEPGQIHAGADTRQDDRRTRTQLVCKVGVDDILLALLDQFDQCTQLLPYRFQHGNGHVFPPFVAGDQLDQHHVRLDGRDGFLRFEGAGNGLHVDAQPHEVRLRLQYGKLCAQHQHVEPLGLFIVVQQGRGQVRHLLAQLLQAVAVEHLPGCRPGEFFDRLAPGPDHEIIKVHGRHLLMQKTGQLTTQLFIGELVAIRCLHLGYPGSCGQPAIQRSNHVQSGPKQPGAQRHRGPAIFRRELLIEKLQILAIVEDIEKLFVLPRSVQIRA